MELFELKKDKLLNKDTKLEYIIRKADKDDVDQIAAMWPDSFIPSKGNKIDTTEYVAKYLEKSDSCYVMLCQDTIVSCAFTHDASRWCNEPALEIAKMATHPDFRGKGFVGVLLAHIIENSSYGVRILLQILPQNRSSINAVEKIGAEYVGKLHTSLFLGIESFTIIHNR